MKKSVYTCVLLLAANISGCVAVNTQRNTDRFKPSIDEIVGAYVDSGVLVGVSVGVIGNGDITTYHYGLTEANGVTPNDHTHYEIGSITKTMTGLLLADGIVQGHYELDTAVGRLVPEAGGLGERVTLRSLSNHSSGLPRLPINLFPLDPTAPYAKYDKAHLFAWLANPQLEYEPGTRSIYSNLAVGLLGYALAQQAGTDYATLLKQRVLLPLGMDESGIELTVEQRAAMAMPHRVDGEPDYLWDLNVLAGAGGVRSTTSDMIKYLSAQLQPHKTPLKRAIILSQSWHSSPDAAQIAKGTVMGLGWFISQDTGWYYHAGQTGGYCTEILFNRDKQIGLFVLSNTSSPKVTELSSKLRQVLEEAY